MECLFCKIANKTAEAEIVYEDDEVLGFKNIHPEAPVHLLFIPKKHLWWEDEFDKKNLHIFNKLVLAAKKTAIEYNIFPACKIVFNIGKTGHIPHIHLHLLGGWKGEVPMGNISKD